MITNFEKSFNIDKIVNLIVMHKFKRVVLQFPDEYLACSIEVYNTISFKLNEYSVDVFITADSSYGSSVDDISALHVNSDCLVYFGGDITYIENIPVIISPPVIEFDISLYRNIISEYIKGDESLRDANNTLLIVDPIYFHCLNNLFETLKCIIPNIHCGIIPPSANLDTWSTDIFAKSDANDLENLASMLVSKALLEDMGIHVAPPLSPSRILYIGHKASSLTSLLVRLPSCDVLSFDPKTDRTVRRHAASKRREMSERFACVTSVQNSRVVGLVVGSMGVTGSLVRSLMADLQALIHATGRKSYCFVMGRLNDSKICNFPEVGTVLYNTGGTGRNVLCSESFFVSHKISVISLISHYECLYCLYCMYTNSRLTCSVSFRAMTPRLFHPSKPYPTVQISLAVRLCCYCYVQ